MMTEGKKNDQDLYDKVDYSMIPLNLIVNYLNHSVHGDAPAISVSNSYEFIIFKQIYDILNDKSPAGSVQILLNEVLNYYTIKPLAVSLGMGFAKYKERNNWMKFDSDPDRFLRAALRHLMAIILGDDYDGEKGIEGYEKGNDHRGAVCFCLMVSDNIINGQYVPLNN